MIRVLVDFSSEWNLIPELVAHPIFILNGYSIADLYDQLNECLEQTNYVASIPVLTANPPALKVLLVSKSTGCIGYEYYPLFAVVDERYESPPELITDQILANVVGDQGPESTKSYYAKKKGEEIKIFHTGDSQWAKLQQKDKRDRRLLSLMVLGSILITLFLSVKFF